MNRYAGYWAGLERPIAWCSTPMCGARNAREGKDGVRLCSKCRAAKRPPKKPRVGMDNDEVFKLIMDFVQGDQIIASTPNGIEIKPLVMVGGSLGGGWRAQAGSGIAGRAGAWTLVPIAAPPEGAPRTTGPYVTNRAAFLKQLRRCPGVVCRKCRGHACPANNSFRNFLGVIPTECKACGNTGVNQLRAEP